MEFCERYEFLRVLPDPRRRLVWSWQVENGTVFRMTENDAVSTTDCLLELADVGVAVFAFLVAIAFILKYKCSSERKSSNKLLPLHATRTLLCILLVINLLVECCESLLTSFSASLIATVIAILSCWTLHRETETRDGFGTLVTGGGFVLIGLVKAWKLLHLWRLGLSVEHVRAVTTSITAACCGLLAVIDSYTLYRTVQKSKTYSIRQPKNARIFYRHSKSTFLSKITFHWVTDLIKLSSRATLDLRDLGELPERESTKHQFDRFSRICMEENLRNPKGNLSLWRCFWKRIWQGFALGGLLKLLGDAMTLVGPMAISKIIDYVAASQNKSTNHEATFNPRGVMTIFEILDNGYFLGLVVFLAALLQSTLSQASTHVLCVEGIRLRTALQGLIYDKALRLCSWNIDEEDDLSAEKECDQRHRQRADIGTLTNLMAEDVYNVMSFFWIGHYTWAIPVKVTAIIFLLYVKLGVSALIGAVCCILIVTPMQLILGKRTSENSKFIVEKSDARLRSVNEILQGMRLIKLKAWEEIFEDRVRETRNQELKLLDKDSLYWALINFLAHASSVLMTLATFGVYFWLEERNLDAGNVFAGLALFSQLTVPLFIFPVVVPIFINAMISTKRLEEFLRLPEITNVLPRVFDERFGDSADDTTSRTNSPRNSEIEAANVQSVTTFGSLDDIAEDEEDQQSQSLLKYNMINCSAETVFEKDPEVPDVAVRIKAGIFSWGGEEKRLTVNELNFLRGRLTLIVGKTGSGKTSLLLAMLGEIQRISGSVEWAKGLKVAYVAQKPWLLNATLRDNVLFGAVYHARRYRNVLRICALQPDIDVLPGRDLTRIGEKGINLSGGQKQRVTIARAMYSDADVIVMDDPLSALDQQVGQEIFDHGIRKFLLRNGRTILMVTHRLDLLSAAHEIVVMDNCHVRVAGTKSAIEEIDPALSSDWRATASRLKSQRRVQKTAKERWSLIKLVSRFGINGRRRHVSDGSWSIDQDIHVSPPAFVPLRMRRSTLSGSRYLAHDLSDLPVPTEEWSVVRKRSKNHRAVIRSSSLQQQRCPPLVLRQNSTPLMPEKDYVAPRKRYHTDQGSQQNSLFKQFFGSRSSQSKDRSNGPVSLSSGIMDESIESEEKMEYFENRDSEEENDKGDLVTASTWLDYSKAGGLFPALTYVGIALVSQAVRVYTDLWLSKWTDSNSLTTIERKNTVFYFKVYMMLSIGSVFLYFVCSASGQWVGARTRRRLHSEAIFGLLGAPLLFFENNPIGRILNRFSADMGVIDKKISMSIQRLMFFVLLCGSAIIVNVIVSPWFLVTAIPTSIAYYLLQSFYRRGARELQRLEGSSRGPVAAHFSETLAGLATLRAFKQEDRFMDEMMKHIDANTNAFLILNTSSRWLGIALDYLGAVIVLTATVTALMSAKLYPNSVTPALVGLAINYALLVPIYLNWVVKFTTEVEMYMSSVARVSAYINAPREDHRDNGARVAEDWPIRGKVVFQNVSLKYDSQIDSVITNFSLTISPGQKIGICGRTGSGKSSIAMALFNLLEVFKGRILIDGIDLQQIPLRVLRSRLSAVPQDSIMFSGTIRENLDPLLEYDDQQLWEALELAQIKDVVSLHPEGLNYEVREGGENFSTGQLQLLCMARTVLHRSKVIILDEATSALDDATEKSVLKAVFSHFKDKTVITIAHRVAALLDCDRIVVLEDGRIAEEGTPEDLLQRPNSFFSVMLKSIDHGK